MSADPNIYVYVHKYSGTSMSIQGEDEQDAYGLLFDLVLHTDDWKLDLDASDIPDDDGGGGYGTKGYSEASGIWD